MLNNIHIWLIQGIKLGNKVVLFLTDNVGYPFLSPSNIQGFNNQEDILGSYEL